MLVSIFLCNFAGHLKQKDMMFNLDYETRTFRPTVEWMKERYNEANEKLFNGALGKCDFGVFTTGRGSRKGGINGWFKLEGIGLRYLRGIDPRLYLTMYGHKVYINRSNFVEVARPKIELNGNKVGSEWAFMVTLVHEMCHYYVEMGGVIPARSHGREFQKIARIVTARSGGQIEVTTKTKPERSKHFTVSRIK